MRPIFILHIWDVAILAVADSHASRLLLVNIIYIFLNVKQNKIVQVVNVCNGNVILQ